jgi:hypothetical protein
MGRRGAEAGTSDAQGSVTNGQFEEDRRFKSWNALLHLKEREARSRCDEVGKLGQKGNKTPKASLPKSWSESSSTGQRRLFDGVGERLVEDSSSTLRTTPQHPRLNKKDGEDAHRHPESIPPVLRSMRDLVEEGEPPKG